MSRHFLCALMTSMLIAGVFGGGTVVRAQTPRLIPSSPTDPMRCWWRTSTSAVHVGEVFSVSLTCSVLETAALRVVPDETRLDPSAFQMPPFEVVDGEHPADFRMPDRRFFQYVYRVRLIDDQAIGRDVPIPSIPIAYRIESQAQSGAAQSGREQVYGMPSQTIRIQSLVPADAADIRLPTPASFSDIEARELRASSIQTVGGVLYGLAAAAGLVTIARVAQWRRLKQPPVTPQHVPDAAVLREVSRALRRIEHDRTVVGWTPELAARALSLFRIGASYAVGEEVSQKRIATNGGEDSEALLLRPHRWWSRGTDRVSVSAASTPGRLAERRVSAGDPAGASAARAAQFEGVLTAFTRARYGRPGSVDETALDEAVKAGRHLVERLAVERTWPVRTLHSVSDSVTSVGRRWSR